MNYAICIVSVSPLRSDKADSSEMISQLLFGECCEVLEQVENWWKVKCVYDNYEGWLDSKQVMAIQNPIESEHLAFQLAHSCTYKDESIPLLLGSSLPAFDGMNFKIEKAKYIYNGKSLPTSLDNQSRLKKIAIKYLNAPYLWGGRSPFGIDCSGLTQMVYKFLGKKLPRDAYQQAELGSPLSFVAEAQLGDLAYFGKEEKITHVGIVWEDGQILHASGKVRLDVLDHMGIYNRETKKYTHQLKVIKRILK
ncbi:MAG: NlpC/P60 family protein [Chitinophagales bacterium]